MHRLTGAPVAKVLTGKELLEAGAFRHQKFLHHLGVDVLIRGTSHGFGENVRYVADHISSKRKDYVIVARCLGGDAVKAERCLYLEEPHLRVVIPDGWKATAMARSPAGASPVLWPVSVMVLVLGDDLWAQGSGTKRKKRLTIMEERTDMPWRHVRLARRILFFFV